MDENERQNVESDKEENKDIVKEKHVENTDQKVGEAKESEENESQSLEKKIEDLEDKLKRTLADMENQRRRFEKEKEEAFDYGGFSFAREALNLIDNLERSKQSLENDEKLKNTEALKKISDHIDIIHKDMLSIFKKNNIEPIKSINEKLNPNLHQAMMEIEDEKKEPGIIIQEVQKGFMMKDRLLRPSLVGVAKSPEKSKEEAKKSSENTEKTIKN